MASLNHVCIWSDHGWVPITADEAAKLHPGGTVSAHSGLFMCELCGQFVTLTDGDIIDPYFKHSASETSKDCPERTFGSAYSPTYTAGEHELPIKLVIKNDKTFMLKLGLLFVPYSVLKQQKVKTITIDSSNGEKYSYSLEQLKEGSITYLPIGNTPAAKYTLTVPRDLTKYWPKTVKGISAPGAIFDNLTGKLLPASADVQANKKYYLLTNQNYTGHFWNKTKIKAKKICEQRFSSTIWNIFELEATDLNEEAAKFFLMYHCRLTDDPLEMRPIWPIHIETPYLIKHNSDKIIMHISGGRLITPQTFPSAAVIPAPGGKVFKISCNGRQQLISVGKANVLQYMYLWQEPLNATTEEPTISVTDSNGISVENGDQEKLPDGKSLSVEALYDGKIIIKLHDQIIDIIPLSANTRKVIPNIGFGQTIQILQGLDVVWVASYKKVSNAKTSADAALFQKLNSFNGYEMEVPHTFGGIAVKLKNYPMTKQWLTQIVKNGRAPSDAVSYLKKYVIHLSQHKEKN